MSKVKGGLLCRSAMVVALNSGLIFASAAHASQNQEREAVAGSEAAEDSGPSQDIIVTAQKREERLQDVPIAVTAITGEQMEKTGANTIERMVGKVPNLQMGESFGVAQVTLRGIGLANFSPGAEGSIAFHINNVFHSRASDVMSGFYDAERIEVLRGPQGTLFGRNATGGSINLITRQPEKEFGGYLQLNLGNYERVETQGAITGPIVDGVLGARLAFRTEDRSGYGENIVTARDVDDAKQRSIRGTLRFTPSPALTVNLVADYHEEDDRAYGLKYFGPEAVDFAGNKIVPLGIALGGRELINSRDIAHDTDPSNDRESKGILLDGIYDFGSVQLRSITSYRRTRYQTILDGDLTELPIGSPMEQNERARQFSEELQLLGETDKLKWVIGGFYFWEKTSGFFTLPFSTAIFGGPVNALIKGLDFGGDLKTSAQAVFGQATYSLTPQLSVTLGGRYSWEKKTVDEYSSFDFSPYNPNVRSVPQRIREESTSFESFTPKVGIEFKPNRNLLMYVTFSEGFKSGTYNLGAFDPVLQPEKVTAYEGGIKYTSTRVQASLAGFYYDYADLQVGKALIDRPTLENAAIATIYGAEFEMTARPVRNLLLDATAAWLHARFDSYISYDPFYPAGDGQTIDPTTGLPAFNLAGNVPPQSPEWQVAAGAEYRIPLEIGTFSLRGEVSWTDKVFFSAFNRPGPSQNERTLVNGFITFTDKSERWMVTLYGRNLTDKYYKTAMYPFLLQTGGPLAGIVGEPRTYGVMLRHNF